MSTEIIPVCCKNCRFYQPFSYSDTSGLCHFNPPIPVNFGDDYADTGFPKVAQRDWCGQFKEKRQ